MLTAAEACELRMFYARYPFDDESTKQLPLALLRADVRNMMSSAGAQKVSALDLMPFYRSPEASNDAEVERSVPYTKKHLKRIAKQLNRKK
jgi:hypothetical protein